MTSQTIDIVRLNAADVAWVEALNRLFSATFDDAETYQGAQPHAGYLARVLAQDHVLVLVALAGNRTSRELVGGLVAYELPKLERVRSEIYIYDLAVAESHRRRGIATALIGRLQEVARERGAWVIYVQADHGDEPAVALYQKLGVREDVMHFDIPVRLPSSDQ